MSSSNKDPEALETSFAQLSGVAFDSAREKAFKNGQAVLQAEGNGLYRVHPDGRKEFVKKIDQPSTVDPRHTLAFK